MNAVIERDLPRTSVALEWGAVAIGFALLLARPSLAGRPAGPLALIAVYASLAWMSLDLGDGVGVGRFRWAVLVVGLAAVVGAALVGGPRPPAPVTAWALPLGVAAAVAEESFFRGLLFRTLSRAGAAVAVGATALAFAAIHVPAYGYPAFWVDLGAGAVLTWQRWATGGWAVPAATHVAANLLAVMR